MTQLTRLGLNAVPRPFFAWIMPPGGSMVFDVVLTGFASARPALSCFSSATDNLDGHASNFSNLKGYSRVRKTGEES